MRRIALMVALLAPIVGCARRPDPRMAGLEGWTLENFHRARHRCAGERCQLEIRSGAARFDVVRISRTHGRDDIPGWGRPRGERMASAVGQTILRAAGGFTDALAITLRTTRVAERGDSARALWCSDMSMVEQRVVKDKGGSDEVQQTRPIASGLRCQVATRSDSLVALWQLRYGIAPPRDSLAQQYDSLAALRAPAVGPLPPISLSRGPRGEAGDSVLLVERDPRAIPDLMNAYERWYVRRPDSSRVAVIDIGLRSRLRLAPGVHPESRQTLRLIAALLAAH